MTRVFAKYSPHEGTARVGLQDLGALKRQIVENTRAERVHARASLAKRIFRLRKRALKFGYQSGCRAARQQWEGTLESSRAEYNRIVSSANRDCLELVLRITEQFLETNLQAHVPTLEKQIAEALAELGHEEPSTIVFHPADRAYLLHHLNYLPVESLEQSEENESLERGTAVLRTRSGDIQFSWRSRFRALADQMRLGLEKNLSEEEHFEGI